MSVDKGDMNVLGFVLNDATFKIHTSNVVEVAHIGTGNVESRVRLYTENQSNQGYILGVHKHIGDVYPSLSIQGSHISFPSIHIHGDSGNVGIGTHFPKYPLEVIGNLYLDGQLIQKASNAILLTEVIQSGTVYSDFITSCNVYGFIDCTQSTFCNLDNLWVNESVVIGCNLGFADQQHTPPLLVKATPYSSNIAEFWYGSNVALSIRNDGNVGIGTSPAMAQLHVAGDFRLDGVPFVHIVGPLQRVQTMTRDGYFPMGLNKIGMDISWSSSNNILSEMDMMEVNVKCTAVTTNQKRMHHHFHALIDTRDSAPSYPGLDSITYLGTHISDVFSRPYVEIVRQGPRTVRILSAWQTTTASTKASIHLDITGPTILGPLSIVPVVQPSGYIEPEIVPPIQNPPVIVNVDGDVLLTDKSFIHVMGSLQRIESLYGQVLIATAGTNHIGFTISWPPFVGDEVIEVTVTAYASGGSNRRMHHRFHAMINTASVTNPLPEIACVTDHSSMITTGFSRPYVNVVPMNANSVRVFSAWTSDIGNYKASMKIEILAPTFIGTVSVQPVT